MFQISLLEILKGYILLDSLDIPSSRDPDGFWSTKVNFSLSRFPAMSYETQKSRDGYPEGPECLFRAVGVEHESISVSETEVPIYHLTLQRPFVGLRILACRYLLCSALIPPPPWLWSSSTRLSVHRRASPSAFSPDSIPGLWSRGPASSSAGILL